MAHRTGAFLLHSRIYERLSILTSQFDSVLTQRYVWHLGDDEETILLCFLGLGELQGADIIDTNAPRD